MPDDERLVAVGFDRLKDTGAAARALLAGDLIPTALEMVDGVCAETLGLPAATPALVVAFDGIAEQVQWQVAELAKLVGPLGGRTPVTLPPATWPRLATLARAAAESPSAVMRFSVLPTLVAETMEQGAQAARQRGLASAWTAHAGVGVVTGALLAGGETATVSAVLGDWRTIAHAGGGHANLMRAPLAVKAQVPLWDDPGAAGRIMQRIKAQLDPEQRAQSRPLRGGDLSAPMAHATSSPPPAAPLTLHGLSVEGVNQCVHCGLCLASCPTFAELGTEMDSPRGRIFLIKSLAEGRIGLSDPTVEHLSLCLDCRACETACPGRRAVRAADRGREGRDRATAAGRARSAARSAG